MTSLEFAPLAGISEALGFINDFVDGVGDLFSGLAYFTGEGFREALAGGFMV